MSAICIFDAGAGGPGNPAPGGASPRQKFLGPAPGGASPRQKFSGPAPAGAFAPAEFSGPAPAGAAAPPGQAPPGAGFAGARPRAPEDLGYNIYKKFCLRGSCLEKFVSDCRKLCNDGSVRGVNLLSLSAES